MVIVGGGLSGLSCALRLQEASIHCKVLEASDGVGGRVRTDRVDGFLLDRGFQVLLTAYPEVRRLIDLQELEPGAFYPGALVYYGGRFRRVSDPARKTLQAVRTLFGPIVSAGDGWRMRRLRRQVQGRSVEDILREPDRSTLEALRQAGFSRRMIERFWHPFLGGVFLDPVLDTSSRLFEFVFKMFASGSSVLPAYGMGTLPQILARKLPEDCIRTGARVESISRGAVTLDSGERVQASAVVVATSGPASRALLPERAGSGSRAVTTLYFAADRSPLSEPVLVLNGTGEGPVNNLCVPSDVSASYSSDDRSLVAVSVLGDPPESDATLENEVRLQLSGWFGGVVEHWQHLRTYRIAHALPSLLPGREHLEAPERIREGLYICGDHVGSPSINGALASGRQAAEAVMADRI